LVREIALEGKNKSCGVSRRRGLSRFSSASLGVRSKFRLQTHAPNSAQFIRSHLAKPDTRGDA
jgi:hypothetical protein